jgi:hypothetical protein
MIKRKIDIEIDITMDEMAEVFCKASAHRQALFFKRVAEITAKWDAPFSHQLQAIVDMPLVDDKTRRLMQHIGQYAGACDAHAETSGG